jgi:hypothetical protein
VRLQADDPALSSVPRSTFAPMLSPYLIGGYRDDELRIDRVDFGARRLIAYCSIPTHFAPQGAFLLSSVVALVGIAQLAILYAHLDSGVLRKESDVFLRDLALRCTAPVRKTSDIAFELRCTARRQTAAGSYYAGDILIEHGAYTGRGAFVLPTLSSPPRAS